MGGEDLAVGPETRCFTDQMMHALFFSSAVYGSNPEAVLGDLRQKFGNVVPLMHHGFDEEGQQAIFAARSVSGKVIVACRGTAGLKDVLQDLKYFHSRLSYAKGAAHWGFAQRAQSVPVELFCELLENGEHLIFTGHSLGGAVASLLSLRVLNVMKGSYQGQVQCITFGAPLFASRSLADLINLHYKDVFIHVVGKKDFVPKLLPVVSALQCVLYGHEDYLEGLSLLSRGLSFLKWLPFTGLLQGLEKTVPVPIKFLLRCVMRLALPSTSWTYAFAGHVVVLDMEEKGPEDLLKVTCTDSLNLWHTQLNFAFAIGFDAFMFVQHTTASYENGVMRALSRALFRHKDGISHRRMAHSDAASLCLEKGCPRQEADRYGARMDGACMSRVSLFGTHCCSRSKHVDESPGGHNEAWHRMQCKSSSPGREHGRMLGNSELCGCRLYPESTCRHCGSPVLSDSQARDLASCNLNQGSVLTRQSSRGSWPQKTNECSKSGSCWEYPVVGRFLKGHQGDRATERWLMLSEMHTSVGRSSNSTRDCRLDGSPIPLSSKFFKEAEQTDIIDSGSETHLSECRACASMQVYRTYGKPTRSTALVRRKGLHLGRLIKTLGRCSRHLRALNKLCCFTFFRIILSHILGH